MQQAYQYAFQRHTHLCVISCPHLSDSVWDLLFNTMPHGLWEIPQICSELLWTSASRMLEFVQRKTSYKPCHTNWDKCRILTNLSWRPNKLTAYWNVILFWLQRWVHSVPQSFLWEDYVIVGDLIQMHCAMSRHFANAEQQGSCTQCNIIR